MKLKITQNKSPYEDIEFEIDGKTYKVVFPLTIELMKKIDEREAEASEGKLEALAEQLSLLTTITLEAAMKLDFAVLTHILKYCHEGISNRIIGGNLKNGSGLTEKKSVE